MTGGFDGREFRRILGHYPTGVCVVASLSNSEPVGMVVGSFTSVSLDPALVAFLPGRRSRTWAKIVAAGHFCVNILAEPQQWICTSLSKAEGRFGSIPHRLSETGLPIIDGIVAWIDCQLDAIHEAGDHFIVVGRVRALDVERPSPPLVFLRGEYGGISSSTQQARAQG